MDDTAISGLVDNEVYTVKLCSNTDLAALATDPSSCTSLFDFTKTGLKPPISPLVLSSGDFPTLVSPATHLLSDYDFSTGITVQWANLSNGTYVQGVSVSLRDAGIGYQQYTKETASTTDTSATVDTSGNGLTVTSATVRLVAIDIYGRRYEVYYDIE